jgi:hypothetical protein
MTFQIVGMFGGPSGGKARGERRSMTVAEARPYLEEAEAERQFPAELLSKEAVSSFCKTSRIAACVEACPNVRIFLCTSAQGLESAWAGAVPMS